MAKCPKCGNTSLVNLDYNNFTDLKVQMKCLRDGMRITVSNPNRPEVNQYRTNSSRTEIIKVIEEEQNDFYWFAQTPKIRIVFGHCERVNGDIISHEWDYQKLLIAEFVRRYPHVCTRKTQLDLI